MSDLPDQPQWVSSGAHAQWDALKKRKDESWKTLKKLKGTLKNSWKKLMTDVPDQPQWAVVSSGAHAQWDAYKKK